MNNIFYKIKELFSRRSRLDEIVNNIQQLENKVEELKNKLVEKEVITIERIIIEKLHCEKVETNYKIDSIVNENLSGTMNVGNIYPCSNIGSQLANCEKKSGSQKTEKPKISIHYE
ncbi:MAG: hypothetical protein VR69_03420 [Peptococcaceae bacterium BRH_c4b]|nr:MAG: hypothetical protein VR69_03420 [Peptococcaceae bacterium BRH_c4b]